MGHDAEYDVDHDVECDVGHDVEYDVGHDVCDVNGVKEAGDAYAIFWTRFS